jgi:hypothetical protein
MQQEAGGGSARGYNEVILDPSAWVKGLPDTIEAVFYHERASPQQVRVQ